MGVFLCFINLAFKLYQYSQTESEIHVLNLSDFILSNDFGDCGSGICGVIQATKLRVQNKILDFTAKKPVFSGVTQNDQNSAFRSIQSEPNESSNLVSMRSVKPTISQVVGAKLPRKSVVTQVSQMSPTYLPNSEGFRRNQPVLTEKAPEQEEVRSELHSFTSTPTEPNLPSRLPEPHKYRGTLYFRPSQSGFGNNLYGLVSAFVISAISNRRLVGRVSE